MFAKLVRWFQTRAQAQAAMALIKSKLPKGYFLAFYEVHYPSGARFSQDPMLVKNDPKRFKKAQPAASIFPGFIEPMLYANEVKETIDVKPFGLSNYLYYAKDAELLGKFLANLPEAKIALDDQREKITMADKKAVDELKVKINELLGDKYFLFLVYTMQGSQPVITKTNIGTGDNIPCAYVYPGDLIDLYDGAPKKSEEDCHPIPPELLNSWLNHAGEKALSKIQEAIVQLERPEGFINWYEQKPE